MESRPVITTTGTSWAAEDRSWLWSNDTIATHAYALRALTELTPKDPRREGLVQWLFLNKKMNHWKSTRATAEVLYSLAHYLKSESALAVREAIRITVGSQSASFEFDPERYTGKKNQLVIPGDKIDPKTSSTVVAEKSGKGLAFVSATWHFSTEKLPEEDRGDFFRVSRRYFRREPTAGLGPARARERRAPWGRPGARRAAAPGRRASPAGGPGGPGRRSGSRQWRVYP